MLKPAGAAAAAHLCAWCGEVVGLGVWHGARCFNFVAKLLHAVLDRTSFLERAMCGIAIGPDIVIGPGIDIAGLHVGHCYCTGPRYWMTECAKS